MSDRSKCIDCEYRYAKPRSKRCNICRKRQERRTRHDAHLKKTYGITMLDYDAMLESQQGTCAICDGGTSKNHFAVDHNHKTGEVRGLLCARCNKILAQARDSVQLLLTAADYLEAPPAREVLQKPEGFWDGWRD